jgi:hypothetical protein
MTPVKVCSICGGATVGFGNDAWPVNDDRCCDRCNTERVIPAQRLWEGDGKGDCGNGGVLQMIDLNDLEEDSFFAIQAADLRWLYDLCLRQARGRRRLELTGRPCCTRLHSCDNHHF